jgi:hypothetical protein
MLGSNLRRIIICLDWGFVVLFSLPLQKMPENSTLGCWADTDISPKENRIQARSNSMNEMCLTCDI